MATLCSERSFRSGTISCNKAFLTLCNNRVMPTGDKQDDLISGALRVTARGNA